MIDSVEKAREAAKKVYWINYIAFGSLLPIPNGTKEWIGFSMEPKARTKFDLEQVIRVNDLGTDIFQYINLSTIKN